MYKRQELHLKTKDVIETITDEDVYNILQIKWIEPICDGIAKLPDILLGVFEKKIKALSDKYADTYEDIENDITAVSYTHLDVYKRQTKKYLMGILGLSAKWICKNGS